MAKRNKIKNANIKDNMFKVIINYLSFKDWIKAFGLIAAMFSIFGITNLNVDDIEKKSNSPIDLFIKNDFIHPTQPPKPSTHKHYKFSFDLDIKVDNDETKTISKSNRIEVSETPVVSYELISKPSVAMAMPPPTMIVLSSSNEVSIIDSNAETLFNKIQNSNEIIFNSTSEESEEYLILINSHKQIKSLWDIYCNDPDFSNQCEIFNHD